MNLTGIYFGSWWRIRRRRMGKRGRALRKFLVLGRSLGWSWSFFDGSDFDCIHLSNKQVKSQNGIFWYRLPDQILRKELPLHHQVWVAVHNKTHGADRWGLVEDHIYLEQFSFPFLPWNSWACLSSKIDVWVKYVELMIFTLMHYICNSLYLI